MEIKFLGATGIVTGSKYLVQPYELLIDAGLIQETHKNFFNEDIQFDPKSLKAIILTHSHIDHSGFIPRLFHLGFRGSVYMTKETAKIVPLLWKDNYKIYAESKKKSAEFLITDEDTNLAIKNIKSFDYHQWFSFDDLQIQFIQAGHILGAASILLKNSRQSVLFSGDLGRFDDPLHLSPDIPDSCDYLILESTYGGKFTDARTISEELDELFVNVKKNKIKKIIISCFALGRIQRLLLEIHSYLKRHQHLNAQLWVDSPLGREILKIYMGSTQLKITNGDWPQLGMDYKICEFIKQRKKILNSADLQIVLTSSGMMEGGPVMSYLENLISSEHVVFVTTGFSAPSTLASEFKTRPDKMTINKKSYPVHAQLFELQSLSSHAHGNDLKEWLKNIKPKKIYLTHGEESARLSLQKFLEHHHQQIKLPELNETVVLE